MQGCYHAVVVFWGVGIPLDLDGVENPPHLLDMATGGDGCGQPGGGGGRLPDTGAAALPLVTVAAALLASGLLVLVLAHRRRATA